MGRPSLVDIYNRLYDRYGPQHWWPGETPFEIIVGAILTQNTAWSNVEKAIGNLNKADRLTPEKLHRLSVEQLAGYIRPAGYFNIKADRLKHFLDWLFEKHGGSLEHLKALSPLTLREQLLAIKGIGPETADSICLYAFSKPIFVVDAYTARIFGRHGMVEPGSGYEQVQDLFHGGLDKDIALYNEYHALIVRAGKEHCKPKPRCSGCPLEDLPHQIEADVC
ncbi:MAG: endonuclease III domain-containing protein [Planctomycetales bacterium]|nr:endonuclease III domain-containing protein [Planctomycetales bacterium]